MKKIIKLFFLLAATCCMAQTNQSWRSFFSYNNTIAITQSQDRVYAASENAVFYKSLATNELNTITSVNGLKAETITAIHHSTAFNRTLVGNNNGLLLIINADNTVVAKVDIVEETTIQSNKKKINHIYEYEGKAYIGCDFGIAVFDIAALEFGDTYRLGPLGAEIPVLQTTVYNGFIYTASLSNGIRRGQLGNPNLNDFSQWTTFDAGNWQYITTVENNLIAGSGNTVYRLNNNTFTPLYMMSSPIIDLRYTSGFMLVTGFNYVRVYNSALQLATVINIVPDTPDVRFTCATVVGERLFMGTQENGVFSTFLSNLSLFENITPNGPLRNAIFSMEKSSNALWAVFGSYSYFYEPNLAGIGISKFTEEGWYNIPYEDIAAVKPAVSLGDIIVKPGNENEVYIASYHSGLLKLESDQPTLLYDDTPTGPGQSPLRPFVVGSYRTIRINSLAYDRGGNLWMTNSMLTDPIKVLRADGQWNSYSVENITSDPLGDQYNRIVIDKNNTKWIASYLNGVIGFNEGLNNKFVTIKTGTGNLPDNYVKALALDNRNQLWIGTVRGLRVLRGVDRFLTDDELTTNSIIILEDGIAQELMFDQLITDIVVDGANNKWIATASAGAFLVSPDGQQTLFHFTRLNSPLPSNNITDIEIDPATGEVFFATDKGMVSYQGTSTKAEDNLNNVYVFPNPVRPGFEGNVNISGLVDRANIKITDIEGNLVYETTSEGGTILWDTRAFGRHKVASGVYMIFISSQDGSETKVKKVMIVR